MAAPKKVKEVADKLDKKIEPVAEKADTWMQKNGKTVMYVIAGLVVLGLVISFAG